MAMAMVDIGVMRIAVRERFVTIPVTMRLIGRRFRPAVVPVVCVVAMAVSVLQTLVNVLVAVPLGEVKPQSNADQHRGKRQLRAG